MQPLYRITREDKLTFCQGLHVKRWLMTKTCDSCSFVNPLKYEICNRIQLAKCKLVQLNLLKHNVCSVLFMYSVAICILSFGSILISDLVADLFMHSLSGMILLYLAAPFLHRRCFSVRLQYRALTQPSHL